MTTANKSKCAWCREPSQELKPMRVGHGLVEVCKQCRWKASIRRPSERKPKYDPNQMLLPFMSQDFNERKM
jgi:hypothetical protein